MQYVIEGTLAALGAGLGALILGALARMTPWMRRRVALWRQRGDTLDRMIEQFQPNGGASMFDRIARTERNVAHLAEYLGINFEEPQAEGVTRD